jgi:hypothetical protein
MRFPVNLVGYSGDLPPGLLTLARRLEAGGDQAPSHVLGPVTALRDVTTTASGVLSGHAILSSEDRNSVRDDLRTAMDALGPALGATAAPSWQAIRKELGRLPKLLETPDGALMLRGLIDAILGQLSSPEVCVAAWSDVLIAFEDETVGARQCEIRIKQLAEVAATGRQPPPNSGRSSTTTRACWPTVGSWTRPRADQVFKSRREFPLIGV